MLTEDDFISQIDVGNDQIGPPDLAASVYLGWTSSPSRIYVGIETVDDVRIDEFEGAPVPPGRVWASDSVELRRIDGDRGGGKYNFFRENGQRLNHLTAQLYGTKALNPTGAFMFLSDRKAWVLDLPYSDAGGAVWGEAPTRSVIELMVTPYDSLDYRGPSFSVESTLSVGLIIGLDIVISDFDTVPGVYDGLHGLAEDPGAYIRADGFREFRLSPSPPNAPTTVESAGWGTVKTQQVP